MQIVVMGDASGNLKFYGAWVEEGGKSGVTSGNGDEKLGFSGYSSNYRPLCSVANAHEGMVTGISQWGNLFFSAGMDGLLRCWRIGSAVVVREVEVERAERETEDTFAGQPSNVGFYPNSFSNRTRSNPEPAAPSPSPAPTPPPAPTPVEKPAVSSRGGSKILDLSAYKNRGELVESTRPVRPKLQPKESTDANGDPLFPTFSGAENGSHFPSLPTRAVQPTRLSGAQSFKPQYGGGSYSSGSGFSVGRNRVKSSGDMYGNFGVDEAGDEVEQDEEAPITNHMPALVFRVEELFQKVFESPINKLEINSHDYFYHWNQAHGSHVSSDLKKGVMSAMGYSGIPGNRMGGALVHNPTTAGLRLNFKRSFGEVLIGTTHEDGKVCVSRFKLVANIQNDAELGQMRRELVLAEQGPQQQPNQGNQQQQNQQNNENNNGNQAAPNVLQNQPFNAAQQANAGDGAEWFFIDRIRHKCGEIVDSEKDRVLNNGGNGYGSGSKLTVEKLLSNCRLNQVLSSKKKKSVSWDKVRKGWDSRYHADDYSRDLVKKIELLLQKSNENDDDYSDSENENEGSKGLSEYVIDDDPVSATTALYESFLDFHHDWILPLNPGLFEHDTTVKRVIGDYASRANQQEEGPYPDRFLRLDILSAEEVYSFCPTQLKIDETTMGDGNPFSTPFPEVETEQQAEFPRRHLNPRYRGNGQINHPAAGNQQAVNPNNPNQPPKPPSQYAFTWLDRRLAVAGGFDRQIMVFDSWKTQPQVKPLPPRVLVTNSHVLQLRFSVVRESLFVAMSDGVVLEIGKRDLLDNYTLSAQLSSTGQGLASLLKPAFTPAGGKVPQTPYQKFLQQNPSGGNSLSKSAAPKPPSSTAAKSNCNLHKSSRVIEYRGHNSSVEDLCFLDKERILVSCSSDCSVRLWDMTEASCPQPGERGAPQVTIVSCTRVLEFNQPVLSLAGSFGLGFQVDKPSKKHGIVSGWSPVYCEGETPEDECAPYGCGIGSIQPYDDDFLGCGRASQSSSSTSLPHNQISLLDTNLGKNIVHLQNPRSKILFIDESLFVVQRRVRYQKAPTVPKPNVVVLDVETDEQSKSKNMWGHRDRDRPAPARSSTELSTETRDSQLEGPRGGSVHGSLGCPADASGEDSQASTYLLLQKSIPPPPLFERFTVDCSAVLADLAMRRIPWRDKKPSEEKAKPPPGQRPTTPLAYAGRVGRHSEARASKTARPATVSGGGGGGAFDRASARRKTFGVIVPQGSTGRAHRSYLAKREDCGG